jgi:hypothetical protein
MFRACSHIAEYMTSMVSVPHPNACAATASRMIFSVFTGKCGLNLKRVSRCLAMKRCTSSLS